ncbi:Uncharacterised protein [Klebsiella pneumoniae]|nr:Uncharacterised protein [Klebsiella variicola]SWI96434.1 Uncharacterised protein [Klebsiella pneumoniae]
MLQVSTNSLFCQRQPDSILCNTGTVLRPHREIVSISSKLFLE